MIEFFTRQWLRRTICNQNYFTVGLKIYKTFVTIGMILKGAENSKKKSKTKTSFASGVRAITGVHENEGGEGKVVLL